MKRVAFWISFTINRAEPYGDYYIAGWLNPGVLSYYDIPWGSLYMKEVAKLVSSGQ